MGPGTWRFKDISRGLDLNCSLALKIKRDLQNREVTKTE